ncbi:hypothetical protein PCANC_14514 [Puccinia coronata f. sp. avenae]|uniref:Uncharacterized protein n=1 Tax=Puccinia coronata f. sp. avenae TaxID=200324 RepID=A0A2N5SQP7_9BASI|nr:hypothetical protein PCANC_14514 [Puccinia coronata f. sp. avenae]
MPPAQPPNDRRAIIPPPEPASPRVLHLDYAVYIRSVSNELARAYSKRLAPASKDWKKSVPKGDIIWKTGMTGWTWHSFKEALIRKLDESRQHEHFGKHLTTLDQDDNLKWKCIVTHHRVYGVKSHAFVSNKAEFEEFAEAVLSSPSSKCTVKILMEDPGALAKKLENEKNEAKELALTYGDKEERASLEKTKTRLACNPKADVILGKRVEITKNLMAYILQTYETTAESMRVRDPKDKNRSIRIPHNGPLHIWARAILMKAAGVDFQNPPDTEDFPSEPIKVWTRDERTAENANAHAARASPNETGVPDSPSGTRKHSEATDAKSNGPKNTPPGTRQTSKPKASMGYSPDEEEPKQKYTPSRKLASGRWMPPRLIPRAEANNTPTPTSHQAPPNSDDEQLPPPLDLSSPDRPKATAPTTKGSAANTSLATGINSPKGGNEKYPVELLDDELSTTSSESNLPPRWAPNSAFNSPDEADNADSSDVEVPHAKASLGVHRSPARSPAGEGVHDEFGRLTFGKNRQLSPSPIRKRPNSQLSSSIASIPPPKSRLSPR